MKNKFIKLLKLLKKRRYILSLLNGVAAAIEHEYVLKLSQAKMIFDIGANKGQFALAAIECLPESRIASFEPLRQPAEKFLKIFTDEPRVKLNRVAIGASSKNTHIHVSASNDSSSLYPIGDLQESIFPGTKEVDQELIRVETLQNIIQKNEIKRPCLLKIDVQGYEQETLKGCELYFDCFDWIYVECSFLEVYIGQALADQIISYLNDRGFKLVGIYNMFYDKAGIAVQGDFLFRPIHRINR